MGKWHLFPKPFSATLMEHHHNLLRGSDNGNEGLASIWSLPKDFLCLKSISRLFCASRWWKFYLFQTYKDPHFLTLFIPFHFSLLILLKLISFCRTLSHAAIMWHIPLTFYSFSSFHILGYSLDMLCTSQVIAG